MKTTSNRKQLSKIVCNLHVGERLKRIQGIEFFKSANEYIVKAEYPYHYLISIKFRSGLVPERHNYLHTSVSKASILCGTVVLIKENGEKVTAHQKNN